MTREDLTCTELPWAFNFMIVFLWKKKKKKAFSSKSQAPFGSKWIFHQGLLEYVPWDESDEGVYIWNEIHFQNRIFFPCWAKIQFTEDFLGCLGSAGRSHKADTKCHCC